MKHITSKIIYALVFQLSNLLLVSIGMFPIYLGLVKLVHNFGWLKNPPIPIPPLAILIMILSVGGFLLSISIAGKEPLIFWGQGFSWSRLKKYILAGILSGVAFGFFLLGIYVLI